ncbi:Cap64 protein [Pterulicium gracile]|uniref:Cap64 protein n=1 Tax=Pterulicium gracile TaxID=1884261 RepID=A0A5C3QZS2_9AGAR|nr:Cap64 protein [Pterula gracilis]
MHTARRRTTGLHISSPPRSPHILPHTPQNKSRRSGTITLFLLAFITLIAFIHFLYPSNPSHSLFPNHAPSSLKPLNYFNVSSNAPNPFSFCPAYGPGDELGSRYGVLALEQSRMHLGSSTRVQRVIQKAMAGQPVTISVIGGSVSTCHGAGDDPISPTCYPALFFNWWNTIFPHPATELTNGALRRTNSAYFGYCSAHHVPDVTDLIIIELDVDDSPTDADAFNFEVLIRSLLLREDKPAVLLLGHFSPQTYRTWGFHGPDQFHNTVAQYYDLPHISIKPALLSHMQKNQDTLKPYFADAVLASPLGHSLLADTLSAYIQSQICATWSAVTSAVPLLTLRPQERNGKKEGHGIFGGIGERKGVLPWNDQHKAPGTNDDVDADGNPKHPVRFNIDDGQPLRQGLVSIRTAENDDRPFEEIAPSCVAANDLINPLPASIFYGSGWSTQHPPLGSSPTDMSKQTSTAHYWYSTVPLSKLRVPIEVGRGDVGVYFIKEPISQVGEGSSVECWVDDNYAGARVLENAGDVGESKPVLEWIDHHVSRGSHYVECQLMGEEDEGVPMFKIIAVFSS